MQIQSLQPSQSVQSVGATSNVRPAAATQTTAPTQSITDQLDLSPEAQALSSAQAAGPVAEATGIRQDKVDSIRRAIAEGTYETPEKLDLALDRLLDTFA